MKHLILVALGALLLFSCTTPDGEQEQNDNQKLVLVTLDGFRWQELFSGADSLLVANKTYVENTTLLKNKYWRETPDERRSALLPFIWNVVPQIGEIHGNRKLGSKMNLTNKMWFSYPGYNEILTGEADDQNITSNDKIYNPNTTFLEELNNSPEYKGEVAAFASWDAFPYIINDKRSGVPVNAGYRTAEGSNLSPTEEFLNKIQSHVPSPFGESARLDFFTDYYALEYMKREHPDVVYIGNDETDDFAHQGKYDKYLNGANFADAFLKELWDFVQNDPYYKGKTTVVVTADHGRGYEPLDRWRDHGSNVIGADETWLIIFGAQAENKGEVNSDEQLYTNEIAGRIKSMLGF